MKPIKSCTLEGLRAAREALERGDPVSIADIAEHERLVAREYARHEARQSEQGALEL